MSFSSVRLLGGAISANGRRSFLPGHLSSTVRALSGSSSPDAPSDGVADAAADVQKKAKSSFVLDLQAGAMAAVSEKSAKSAEKYTSKRSTKPLDLKGAGATTKPKPAAFTSKRDKKPTSSPGTGSEGESSKRTKPAAFVSKRSSMADAKAPPTPELGNASSTASAKSSAATTEPVRMASRRQARPPVSDRSEGEDNSSPVARRPRDEDMATIKAPSTTKPAVKFTARRKPVGTVGSSIPEHKVFKSAPIEEDDPKDPRTKAKQWESRRKAREAKEQASGGGAETKGLVRTETRRIASPDGGGDGDGGGRGGGRGGGGGKYKGKGGRRGPKTAKPETQEERIKEFAERFVRGTGMQEMPVQMLLPPLQLRQDLFNKHQLDPVGNSFTRLAQAYRMRPDKVAGIIRMVGLEKDREAETGVLDYSNEIAARKVWGESWVQFTQSREEDLIRRHNRIKYTVYDDDELSPDERLEERKQKDAERKLKWKQKEIELAAAIARDAATSKGLSEEEVKEAGEVAGRDKKEELEAAEKAKADRVKAAEKNVGGRGDVSNTPWGGPTEDDEVSALDAELYERFWQPKHAPTHVIKEVGKYIYRDVSKEIPGKHSQNKSKGIFSLKQLKTAAAQM